MRYGDYIVALSITLNASAMIAYSWQGHWLQACYWLGALCINLSLLGMK
jgi:hypothetical protein